MEGLIVNYLSPSSDTENYTLQVGILVPIEIHQLLLINMDFIRAATAYYYLSLEIRNYSVRQLKEQKYQSSRRILGAAWNMEALLLSNK